MKLLSPPHRYLVLLGMLLPGGPALAAEEDCDSILVSSATNVSVEQRGQDVQRCLDLASAVNRAAYQNSYPSCRRLVLAREVPTAIELPSGALIEPSTTATTWEEFSQQMAEGALESGCRDGIRSALHQILFSSTPAVQEVFTNTALQADDLLVGDHGTVIVEDTTTLVGYFTGVHSIQAAGRGQITFGQAPLELTGEFHIKLRVGNMALPVVFHARATGAASGILDTVSLDVRVQDYEVHSIEVLTQSALKSQIEQALREGLVRNKERVLETTSVKLTDALKKSYHAADPFHFFKES